MPSTTELSVCLNSISEVVGDLRNQCPWSKRYILLLLAALKLPYQFMGLLSGLDCREAFHRKKDVDKGFLFSALA